jgi:hypothetical protein
LFGPTQPAGGACGEYDGSDHDPVAPSAHWVCR